MKKNEERKCESSEANKCTFCGEKKPVSRFYVRVKNKHFDDNERGQYSAFFYYCEDCGIEPQNNKLT